MNVDESLSTKVRNAVAGITSPTEVFRQVATIIRSELDIDRVVVSLRGTAESFVIEERPGLTMEVTPRGSLPSVMYGEDADALGPLGTLFVTDPRYAQAPERILARIRNLRLLSIGVARFGSPWGVVWVEAHSSSRYLRWRREERTEFEAITRAVEQALKPTSSVALDVETTPAAIVPDGPDYRRLLEIGEIVVVKTNTRFEAEKVHGDTLAILGISAAEIEGDRSMWMRLIHPDDLRHIRELLLEVAANSDASGASLITEEIRVTHQKSGEVRKLIFKARPLRDADGIVVGWEGFGLDVTEKRAAEEALTKERTRTHTLYHVLRAVQLASDRSGVAAHGLKALVTDTESAAGVFFAYDFSTDSINVVSGEGLSGTMTDSLTPVLRGENFVRTTIERRQGLVIDNLAVDRRIGIEPFRHEGMRSLLIVPVLSDDVVVGSLALMSREVRHFDAEDLELMTAVCSHLALALKNSEYYENERKHARAVAGLYRLSHELSKHWSARDVAENAFLILQEELGIKRMWLGTLAEQGGRVVGEAALGPGMRTALSRIQVDVEQNNRVLKRILERNEPELVESSTLAECAGISRVLERLSVGTCVVCPLTALNQPVGVLVLEPNDSKQFMSERKLGLATRMAGEIATVLLARRFEARMADFEKMRMAGVLASGVAHHFNNLLQAVMGQASLIDLQSAPASPLKSSAQSIMDSASRGAALVKQLLSFTSGGASERMTLPAGKLLGEARDFYRSVLGTDLEFEMQIPENLPSVHIDSREFSQVMANLLLNAREALHGRTDGKVTMVVRSVTTEAGDITQVLPPGSYVKIDIEDNGPGMDAERQARCFEPFYTTKRADTLTGIGVDRPGLGLSTAYSIMRRHEGLITVQSEPGNGAVFSLYLPKSDSVSDGQSADAGAVTGTPTGGTPEAFIIGFEPAVEASLVHALRLSQISGAAIRTADVRARLPEILGSRMIFVNLDDPRIDVKAIGSELSVAPQSIQVVAATEQRVRAELLRQFVPRAVVVDPPRGMWGVQSLVRRATSPLTSNKPERRATTSQSSATSPGQPATAEPESKPTPQKPTVAHE